VWFLSCVDDDDVVLAAADLDRTVLAQRLHGPADDRAAGTEALPEAAPVIERPAWPRLGSMHVELGAFGRLLVGLPMFDTIHHGCISIQAVNAFS
jgi:hypothetical protein